MTINLLSNGGDVLSSLCGGVFFVFALIVAGACWRAGELLTERSFRPRHTRHKRESEGES